jgi:hypothetical protein
MIARMEDNLINLGVGHHAGHFNIRNYETFNPTRATSRSNIKEEEKKDTHVPSTDGGHVSPKICVEIYPQQNHSLPR